MNFCPCTAIKRQAQADFIAEFTYADTAAVVGTANIAKAEKVVEAQGEKNYALTKGDAEQWTFYVDNASNDTRSRAVIMSISPKRHKIHCALHFRFKALNNEVKFEALITGLCLAKELQARNIQIYSDSYLVVN